MAEFRITTLKDMNNQKTNQAHILLVENNEWDVLLTLEAFEECKVKTKTSVVKNGQEALYFLFHIGDYTNAKKPALILLDINILIFSGHEVLERIKSDSNLKKIPVIMLTTYSSQKNVDKAYENHCNSYVKKPIEITEFLITTLKIEEFWLEITVLAINIMKHLQEFSENLNRIHNIELKNEKLRNFV